MRERLGDVSGPACLVTGASCLQPQEVQVLALYLVDPVVEVVATERRSPRPRASWRMRYAAWSGVGVVPGGGSAAAPGGYPPFSCVRGIAGGVRKRRRVIAAAATAPPRMTAQYPTTR
jgi:hypothetical protein